MTTFVQISEVPRRPAFLTPFVRRLCKDACTALAGRGARTVLLVTSGAERSWYPIVAGYLAFGYPRSLFGTLQIDALFAQLGQESQSKLLTIDQLSDSCVSACRCCIGNHHYSVQPGLTLVYVRLRCVRFATCDEVTTQVFDGHQYITRRKVLAYVGCVPEFRLRRSRDQPCTNRKAVAEPT